MGGGGGHTAPKGPCSVECECRSLPATLLLRTQTARLFGAEPSSSLSSSPDAQPEAASPPVSLILILGGGRAVFIIPTLQTRQLRPREEE